jgi:hypothetical protein
MPPASTHLRFASLILPRLSVASLVGPFVLGSLAPDTFEPASEDSFVRHHFLRDGRIHLRSFRRITSLPDEGQDPTSAFVAGYDAHLWLDVYFGEHSGAMVTRRPTSLSEAEIRRATRLEADFLHAPAVAAFLRCGPPDTRELALPPGLGFVDLERCAELWRTVREAAANLLGADVELVVLDEGGVRRFIEEAAEAYLRREADRSSRAGDTQGPTG